ncbi:arylsulfatase [Dyadobacter sp. CY323]|uniref:arylsulfatase n=1 Tax=Dyadobacter sp. CY323 TaxID=2907302 RepID=UPI001F442D9C|nr:arylsulfatase [Dyadobacter sp. CY323]MCE6991110.1 arylsulfatase [Dyadobacter sp. CY323]
MKKTIIAIFALFCTLSGAVAQKSGKKSPNIIYILSDDLNWGDTGPFGQKLIRTPNIDRLAREGMKFTQAYAGNAVCAPSRSCLMQGKHPGHARVRDNGYKAYRESLRPGDFTVAHLLQNAGYKTGLFGKWGLSVNNQPGLPNDMGFDEFYGYLNQQHAHTYYPEFLYHNKEKVYFPGNQEHYKLENYSKPSPYDADGKVHPLGMKDPSQAKYSFDVYAEKSLEFVKKNKDAPFFLYLAYTLPHGQLIVPELGEYKDKDWPIQHKEWAAMVTRMDTEVGKLLALLKELGLDENTVILFSSDNGNPSGYEKRYVTDKKTPSISQFFNLSSPTRGGKGNTYDGAFHVPALARWTKHIAPGQVSDHVWAFWDFLPTAAEIAGVTPPSDIDGISFLPTLLGKKDQKQHEFLYWEFDQDQALRYGKWYVHKSNGGEIELYDLVADPQQSKNQSQLHPDIIKRATEIFKKEHTPSDVWPSPGEQPEAFEKRLKKGNIHARESNVSLY